MHSGTTRDRLMAAAEELLAAHGSAGMSVRDVLARAAVANAAAVGYHFGGKDALVATVERRVVDRVLDRRGEALAACRGRETVEALVDGWVRPVVELRCAGRGRHAARVFSRIFDEPQSAWEANGAAAVLAMGRRYREASAPLVPHLDAAELGWRWQCVTSAMAFDAEGALDFDDPGPTAADVDRDTRRLVVPGTAVLLAPPA